MTIMDANVWAEICKAQQKMKCMKCGKITETWKELLEHKEKFRDHFNYKCIGFGKIGVSFL